MWASQDVILPTSHEQSILAQATVHVHASLKMVALGIRGSYKNIVQKSFGNKRYNTQGGNRDKGDKYNRGDRGDKGDKKTRDVNEIREIGDRRERGARQERQR